MTDTSKRVNSYIIQESPRVDYGQMIHYAFNPLTGKIERVIVKK